MPVKFDNPAVSDFDAASKFVKGTNFRQKSLNINVMASMHLFPMPVLIVCYNTQPGKYVFLCGL